MNNVRYFQENYEIIGNYKLKFSIHRRNPGSPIFYTNIQPNIREPISFNKELPDVNIPVFLSIDRYFNTSRKLAASFKDSVICRYYDRFIVYSGTVYDIVTNNFIFLITRNLSYFNITHDPNHIKYTLEVNNIIFTEEFSTKFKYLISLHKKILKEFKEASLNVNILYTDPIKGLPKPINWDIYKDRFELLNYCFNFVETDLSEKDAQTIEYVKQTYEELDINT